jgi:hypothetical protein
LRAFRKAFMSRRNLLALFLITFGLFALAGCGSGGSAPKFAPPATGSYTNASLSGTYAFSVSGVNQAGFLALAGSLQSDGNGNFTSGVEDVNSGTGVFTNVPVTGTYNVSADGRGLATLNSAVGTFTIDFVIVSSNRALAVRFDPNSSASGSFDKQDSSAFSNAALTGQYAFSLSGIGANVGTYQSAGLFVANGAGSLSSGIQDFNNNGTVATSVPLSGAYAVGTTNGRGTLSLTTSLGTLNFVFYIVDANHLKVMEADSVPVLAGDAYRQTGPFSNASLSGSYAFTVGGGLSAPFVAGGVFTADGNGAIATGAEDFNSGGSLSQNVATTGSYSISSTGRGTLTLTNSAGTFSFSVYPSTGGLIMMGIDSTLPESGSAFLQTGLISASPNSAISGNYGFNLTGVSNSGEVDSIARMAADSNGNFTGALDINLAGSLSRGLAFNGPYTLSSNGRGTATLTSSAGGQNFVLYFVSTSRVLFIETDSGLVGVGVLESQQ